ncbi:MAG: N-acetyltransferase, partial [Chthoniobacteraceae bacterium]
MHQPAIHAHRRIVPDPADEIERSAELRRAKTPAQLAEMLDRCAHGSTEADSLTRRILWRARLRRLGNGVQIGRGVLLKHPETLEIGDGVFIGDQAILQGRFDGSCVIGDRAWIGPQCFLDARALIIGEASGLGPGVRILCSEHTGEPAGEPVISTPQRVAPVQIGKGADVGMGALILPGVTLGEGCIIGAGAVVTADVPPFTVAAGVPAQVVRHRKTSGEG